MEYIVETSKHVSGVEFKFVKTPAAPILIKEIFNDNYKVLQSKIEFRPGDIILDAGANEGIFSIWMAKLFPKVNIISLEPVPETYFTLTQNLQFNGVLNIVAYNVGLGKSHQPFIDLVVARGFSGGSTSLCTFDPKVHDQVKVNLISLDAAFELYGIKRIRLLKMDIEGMEYDVLYSSRNLNHVDYFTGEIHINQRLEYQSRRPDGLINWVGNQTKVIHTELCKMAE